MCFFGFELLSKNFCVQRWSMEERMIVQGLFKEELLRRVRLDVEDIRTPQGDLLDSEYYAILKRAFASKVGRERGREGRSWKGREGRKRGEGKGMEWTLVTVEVLLCLNIHCNFSISLRSQEPEFPETLELGAFRLEGHKHHDRLRDQVPNQLISQLTGLL
jgi:hypothetical protein